MDGVIISNLDISSNGKFNSFYEYLVNQGYYFDYSIVESLLLSIKSNPFIIIMGSTGCGKSVLPILFSRYLSEIMKKEDIILYSVNSLGKSYSNKEWHLKRDVISELLPVLPFEGKECLFTVNDSFKSVGKFKLDPRFKFTDRRLINHLLKLSEENPNQDLNLKIKVGEKSIKASYLKIIDLNKEFGLFLKSFQDDSQLDFLKFLNNSKKDKDNNHFLIVEDIDEENKQNFIRLLDYIIGENGLNNNLFVVGTVNSDNPSIFSQQLLDRVNVLELENTDVEKYLSCDFNTFPEFKDLNYLEFFSEDLSKLSIYDFKDIFQEIVCDESDLWSLISDELILINHIFINNHLEMSFRTINDVLKFMFISWKYEKKPYIWKNWEKYFDIQFKQKLIPKIYNSQNVENICENLMDLCRKSDDIGFIDENIKFPKSYLKLKNIEYNFKIGNYSLCHNSIKDIPDTENIILPKNNKKTDVNNSDKNTSKYGSNIYKYGEFFTINKQINRKHINFGKFNSLSDATFVKSILINNDWKLSRIRNNDCIYLNNDLYYVIKVLGDKLVILGKFYSYDEANEHIEWLVKEYKNNNDFEIYIPKKPENHVSDMADIINEIKGWNKLVFKAITEIEGSVFSLNDLKQLNIFEMYQFEDQSLESTILENLDDLADLKLIEILGNNYYKKVV